MDPIVPRDNEISGILGADPEPLQNLVKRLSHTSPEIKRDAMSMFDRCVDADADLFLIRLTSMVAFLEDDDDEIPMCLLQQFLASKTHGRWNTLTVPTKDTIKQLLLGCVSFSDQQNTRLNCLSMIIGNIALASIQDGEPCDDLLSFVMDSLYCHSEVLQFFALLVMGYAPQLVKNMLETDSSGKLQSISDRITIFLNSDDLNLKFCSLQAIIKLWVRLSYVNKIVIKEIVTPVFKALSFIVHHDEVAVGELLKELNHRTKPETLTVENHMKTVIDPLIVIGESETVSFNTKCQALKLMLKLLKPLGMTFDPILITYWQRIFQVNMCLMSEEDEENGDGNRLHLNFGKTMCGNIICMFGAHKIIYSCEKLIDAFMRDDDQWRKRRASIIVVGLLSSRIPDDMEEAQMEIVMNWIVRSLENRDENVLLETGIAIKRLAPYIRGCHENLIIYLEKILCNLSVKVLRTRDPRVKGCLQAAYEKLKGR